MRVVTVAMLLGAASALAQDARPERLYISPNALTGSPRVVGLGGAYVGIAEGSEAMPENLAALAHRKPFLKWSWDFDGTFSILDIPIGDKRRLDLDNDGQPDQALASGQFMASFGLQIRRFGIGASVRQSSRTFCSATLIDCSLPENSGERLDMKLYNAAAGVAYSFFHDDLILGAGMYTAQAAFDFHDEEWSYVGYSAEFDALFRPNGFPGRIGMSYKPEVEATWAPKTGQGVYIAASKVYKAVVSPSILSVGGSLRLGEGANNYNRLSPVAREIILKNEGEKHTPPEVPANAPFGTWLLSAQVDFIFPVNNAVSPTAFTSHSLLLAENPEFIAKTFQVMPRLGIENDTIPTRLRVRAGTYYEPSPFTEHPGRWHGTGGFELRLFKFIADWSVFSSFDLAERYQYLSVGVSLWQGPPVYRPKPKDEDEEREEREDKEREEREREAPPPPPTYEEQPTPPPPAPPKEQPKPTVAPGSEQAMR